MAQVFGELLRDWRRERRMSQLDLGLAANVSSRHIAFLETGRARPSRTMVMQLSDTMQVPRAARNVLLSAAGFSEIYRQRDMNGDDMAPIRAAVAWTLERHDPYPALALDRHWVVLSANACATRLLAAANVAIGDSLLQALITSETMRAALDNRSDVVRYLIARLRTESAQLGGDQVLDDACKALSLEAEPASPTTADELSAVVPTRYRFGGAILSLFSTIAHFGTAEDIALADIKIELMFPADDATRAMLLAAG